MKLLSQKISTIPIPLKVKSIGLSKYKFDKFVFANFYISDFNQKNFKIYIYIKYKLHLLEDLKVNMIICTNIFYTKGFSIKLINASAYTLEYRVIIKIIANSHSQFLRPNILANATIFIPPKFKAFISFQQRLLLDLHNFLFNFCFEQ